MLDGHIQHPPGIALRARANDLTHLQALQVHTTTIQPGPEDMNMGRWCNVPETACLLSALGGLVWP